MGNKVCCENGSAMSLSPLDSRHKSAKRLSPKSKGTDQKDGASSSVFFTLDKLEICKSFSTYLEKELSAANQSRIEQDKEIFEDEPKFKLAPAPEENLQTIFDNCYLSIQDEQSRVIHSCPMVQNEASDALMFLDQESFALTRNSTAVCDQDESMSVAPSLKQKIISAFKPSSSKNKVPRSLQLDEVFEVEYDALQQVELVTLTFWKSKQAFDYLHLRTQSMYDGFGVNLKSAKQSMQSNRSEGVDASQFLFGHHHSPQTPKDASLKNSSGQIPTEFSDEIYGTCEIKVKSMVKESYNSDWFKIKVNPTICSQSKQLKKNEVIAKILISTQRTTSSKFLPQKSDRENAPIVNMQQRSKSQAPEIEIDDLSEKEFYEDSQESLNTLFCNTFRGFSKPQVINRSQNTLVATARDDSLATIYNNREESMNLNQIQNLIKIDQKQLLFPGGPSSNFSDCMSCFKSQGTAISHRDVPVKPRNVPRKGALRQRCQDCGSLLSQFNGIQSESQDYLCEECRNENQDNESIAIKIPMDRTKSRDLFESHRALSKSNKLTNKGHYLMSARSQPKKLKSFYHEEIEQLQMQLQTERNDDTVRQTHDDIRTDSLESQTNQSMKLKPLINALSKIDVNYV